MNYTFKNYFKFSLLLNLANKFPVDLVIEILDEWFLFFVWSKIQWNPHIVEDLQSDIRGKLVSIIFSSFPKSLSIDCDCQSIEPMLLDKFYDPISVLLIFEEVKLHYFEPVLIAFGFRDLWYFSGWHHAQAECGFSLPRDLCWEKLALRSDESLHGKRCYTEG